MSPNSGSIEQRRHPRYEKKLPIKVRADSFDIVSETQNISLSGAYFQADRYIEPMTKIEVIMLLPIKQKNGKVITKKLHCKGVVVRTEKSQANEGKFNIALYFLDMKKADIANITRYIESHREPIISPQ